VEPLRDAQAPVINGGGMRATLMAQRILLIWEAVPEPRSR
jgi:hypothetical protein